VDRLLASAEVVDVVDEAAVVAVDDLGLGRLLDLVSVALPGRGRSLVRQHDGETAVEEGHLTQPRRQGLEAVVSRLEDVLGGPEGDLGAGVVDGTALGERRIGNAVGVGLRPQVALAPDRDIETLGERVDDGDADTVQPAGNLVAAAAELAAGVQNGQDDLDGRASLALDVVDRDAATVVEHPHATVGQQRDLDAVAVAGQSFVDGVVHDLGDQVMQAALAGGADVHAGSFADGLETLEDLDRASVVGRRVVPHPRSHQGRRRGGFVRGGRRGHLWVGLLLVGLGRLGHRSPFVVLRSSPGPRAEGPGATVRVVVAARCEPTFILPVRGPRSGHQGRLGTAEPNQHG